MKLALLGINYRTAPTEVRERFAFAPPDLPGVLSRLGQGTPAPERVLLRTCNRTELYLAGDPANLSDAALIDLFRAQAVGANAPAASPECFYIKRDQAAVEHLFAVASSLDSLVVGETEVLGQVKQAYRLAAEQNAVGPLLHSLFQTTLRVAKRVHAETDISHGRVSVSSIAVEFVERVFDDLAAKTIMIVGAGETAELALRSLAERGVMDVLVLNRSPERAVALAQQYGGKAIPFELLKDYLARADVVIASTDSPIPLVQANDVRKAVDVRRGRPMLLVDLSMPRNVDPAAGKIANVYLCHIDDLQEVAAANLKARRGSVDKAWQVVREESRSLAVGSEAAGLGALLRDLDTRGLEIRDEALRRYFNRPHARELSPEAREELVALVDKVIRKMLDSPRDTLKAAARNGHWEEYARIARALFRFDREGDREGPE